MARANDDEFWPITAVDDLLATGQAQFWCDGRAALVTRVVSYPGGAVAVEPLAAAGRKASLVGEIADAVEVWAKSIGATHLRFDGRPGWQRVLGPGWVMAQVVMVKELADG